MGMWRRRVWVGVVACGLLGVVPVGTASADDGVRAELCQDGEDAKALTKKGKAAYKKKDYDGAIELFKKALAQDPKHVPAYEGLGAAYKKKRDWQEAVKAYESALEVDPSWVRGHYQLGLVHRKMGNYDKSIAGYERYIEAKPEDPDAYYGLGQAHFKAGNNAKAVEILKLYIEKEDRPKEQKYVARAKELIASLEAEPDIMGQPDGGGGGVADAEPVPDGDYDQMLRRGDMAFEQDNLTEAVRYYRGAARKETKGVEAQYKLGVVLAIAGDLVGAISAWEAVLERQPDMAMAKQNIERARKKLQTQADKGIDDPRLGQDAATQLELARGYVEAGRHAMALRVLDALMNQNPEDGQVRAVRGQALMGLGRYNEARQELALALATKPGEASVLLALGQTHMFLGDEKEARYFLSRYLERVDPAGRDSSLEPLRQTVARLGNDGQE